MPDPIDLAAGVLAELDEAVVVCDRDQRIVLWNAAAEALFEISTEDALGQDRRLIERDGEPTSWFEESLSGGRLQFRADRWTPAGSRVPVDILAAPVRGPEGAVIGVSQILRPVSVANTQSGQGVAGFSEMIQQDPESAASLLKEAVDAMDDAVSIYDASDRFVFGNQRYFELYPFLRELPDLEGRAFEDILRYSLERGAAGNLRDVEAYAQRRIRDRQELRRMPERHMPDGSWYFIKENRSPSGYTIATRTDITRRKESELALASATVVLQAILDTMPNPLIAFDRDNHLVAWNRSFERLVNMPRGGLYQGRSLVGVAKDTIRRVPSTEHGIKRMFRAISSGEAVEFEWQREGERLFFVSGRPMADGGYLSMWRDVTAERRAQQLVAETQQRLIDAIETMSEGFVLFDRQDRLVLCNTKYREAYAIPDAAVAERWTFERLLSHGLEIGRFEAARGRETEWLAERLAHHEDPSSGPTSERLDDGRVLLISETRTRDGGVVGIRADITDRIRTEEALRTARDELADKADSLRRLAEEIDEARRRAEGADAAKSRFLAMMSHELRTPLTGLLGMVELLSRTHLSADQAELLRLMRMSAEMLLALLNDILDYSKLEAGKVQLEEIPFAPRRVIDDVMHLFEVAAASKGLKLIGMVDPSLPDSLRGDPLRLKQILSNLVSNAVKFTEHGNVTLSLEPGDAAGGRIQLLGTVADTGIGISPEAQENLFAAFEQGDQSTSRRYGGTGLGLSICKRLVEGMGGWITLDSRLGEGSVFRFSVSMEPTSAEPRLQATGDGDVEADPEIATKPARILLVEDNDVNRMLVSRMLAQDGHRIDEVIDGSEAVAAVQRNDYDLILMDMQMPVMDGAEATRRIREFGPDYADLPIIALTADALPEHQADYLAAGVNDVLLKPINWRQLQQMIARRTTSSFAVSDGDGDSRSDTLGDNGSWQETATDAPVFDSARLSASVGSLPLVQAAEMISLVPEEAARQLEDFDRAAEQGDLAAARRSAHSIKGLAANFGAARLEVAARNSEAACHSVPQAIEASATLRRAVEITREAVPAVLAELRQANADTGDPGDR